MKILFLCSANVGRSQIAEGYYNYFTKSNHAISAALIEDKGKKYNFSPSNDIIQIMNYDGIDISHQKIKLLNNQYCESVDIIVVLCNVKGIKSEFDILGENAIDYVMKNYSNKITFFKIDDPFMLDSKNQIIIRDKIKNYIKQLIFNTGKT